MEPQADGLLHEGILNAVDVTKECNDVDHDSGLTHLKRK